MADFGAMAAAMKGLRPAGVHPQLAAATNDAGGHDGPAQQQVSGAAAGEARQSLDRRDGAL